MAVIAAIGWTLCALSLAGGLLTTLAAVLLGRFMGKPTNLRPGAPAVTILKPLSGATSGLGVALESFCQQDYPGVVQIVLGVQDPADPAIEVVERLRLGHPDLDIVLVVDETLHGANRKVSNLINMARRARWDVLVLSDADVVASRDYLRCLVSELGGPGVGAVTCLYHGRGVKGLWSTLSAMGIDYRFAPSVVLGLGLGLARPCLGPSIALAASLLERIGGFARFSDCLADDYEIGRAVRQQGLGVVLAHKLVTHTCAEDSFQAFMDHEIRWARTVRLIDAVGYSGSGITHPLPLALLGAAMLGFQPACLGLIFAILVARIGSKSHIDAAMRTRAGPWWLVPASDLLAFIVFIASFLSNVVVWGGRRFRVGRDGALSNL